MRSSMKPLLVAVALMLMCGGSAWAAAITSISPALGPASGGTVVTIKVAGLGAAIAVPMVKFGTAAAVAAVGGGTAPLDTLTVTSPVSLDGPVAVTVEVLDGAVSIASRAGGFSYTNVTLIINVKVNIAQIIAIRWATTITTTADDTLPTPLDHTTAAQSISAFAWSINDGGRTTPLTDLNTSYINNAGTEAKDIAIESLSKTNPLHIKIRSTNPTDGASTWTLGNAAAQAGGPDVVNFTAKLGASNTIDLTNADQTITDSTLFGAGAAPLVKMTGAGATTPQTLILTYRTPSSATQGFNTDMLSTVTLTASIAP